MGRVCVRALCEHLSPEIPFRAYELLKWAGLVRHISFSALHSDLSSFAPLVLTTYPSIFTALLILCDMPSA